jgi:tetratricopeptide (TPR) repeat protein
MFEELSRHKPNYPDLREWLARAYLRANALASATPAVQRALEEKPDSPTRIACAVWESTLRAQLDAAVKRGEEAVVAYPDCGFLRYRVAEAYRALRRSDMMGQHLAAGAALGDEECLWAYAEHIYTTGNKDAALKAYQAFLDKVPAGEMAKRARQMVLNLTTGPGPGPGPGPTGTTPPPIAPSTAATLESILGRLETLVNRPYDPMGEPVDMVYAAMIASTAQAWAAADKTAEVTWLGGDLARAERLVVEGLSGLRTAAPNVLADARSRRIRDRFAEMAALSDRFVAAWGALARKMNPSVGGRIDETVTRWPTIAPKDHFEKVAMAFDTVARMVGLAVGDQGAGEILDRLDAHLLICDNTIQKGVARLHALAALVTLGMKNAEALTAAFNEADDKAESGLAQMQVALTKLAEYAAARRAGK